ncbi:MAG: DUF1538 domain-containing protein [Clostridia bacterium]|nr:DUF1538 domain-containing protein [Clostridia bacterium]
MTAGKLREKLKESLVAVLPIIAIVLLLSFTVAPTPAHILLAFLVGGALLTFGMMLFNIGAEMAMEPMGEKLGARLTKTRKLPLFLILGLLLGFMITVSEPDLQVLANQVQSVPNIVLIASVALGVGLMLAVALLRMLFGIPLKYMLFGFYALVFLLTVFAPKDFISVAFDSGGVTTGPMTVPFIMAFGIGIASIRSDRNAADDSFGLIALCSVGPIISVLALGMIYRPENAAYSPTLLPDATLSVEMARLFTGALPEYVKEMALALLPIAIFFALFQIFTLKLEKKTLIRIAVGVAYTYIGLVLFLTGVNIGFMPAGSYLGQVIAGLRFKWILVPIAMLIGYFIVRAEPAVYVLMRQVEDLTDGAIGGKSLRIALSAGVCVSLGLAMTRVLTGISVLWILAPCYAAAIALSFFTPRIFTAIAFDSGGVASGPMTATFLLPFSVGACAALGGNVVTDAFGVVAMVAMTPLLTIQILGIIYQYKTKPAAIREEVSGDDLDIYEIIEL